MGSSIFLTLDDVAIECTTSVSENHSKAEIDVSCKNTTGASDFLTGELTSEYQVEGILTDGTTTNKDYNAIKQACWAGTVFEAYIGGVDVGDHGTTQDVICTTVSMQSGDNKSASTWSATLKGKGDPAHTTVA